MVVPVFVATFVGQAGYIVDRILASGLVTGSIAALNYASLVSNVVLGIFVTALVTVLYPTLSRYTARRDHAGFLQAVRRSLGVLTVATMPLTVGVIILAVPLIRVVYQRGAFGPHATQETAVALAFFSVGLVGNAAALLLPRAFFALKDTRTPTFFGIAAVAVNIAADLALVHPLKVGGLALGTSLAQWALPVVLLWRLRRRLGPLGGSRLAATAGKALVAAAVMGAVVDALYRAAVVHLPLSHFLWSAALLAILALLGAGVYGLMAWALKVEELTYLLDLAREIWTRRLAVLPGRSGETP
jgi:putative peptidoglycan lipid II flippase